MTIEGANNFYEATDYIIYTMNSGITGPYCAIIPKNITNTLNMLIDLHWKGAFDGLANGSKTKDTLVEDLNTEYNTLKVTYPSCMLVIPMIEETGLELAINNGEKQKMFDEVKKISTITSDLYKKLTTSGIDKQKIDQKIIIVEKKIEDEKFITWLKEQMPNFVDSITYKTESASVNVNPFMSGDIFQNPSPTVTEPTTPVASSPTSIFDNIAPVVSETPVTPESSVIPEPSAPVEPVGPTAPVGPTEPTASAPITNEAPTTNVDIFGIPLNTASAAPTAQSVQEPVTPQPAVNPTPNPVPEQPSPVVANSNLENTTIVNPQPVQSVGLEGTTTFSPIPEPVVAATAETDPEKKGSKGFVNLAILLIVLVGVTIFSIELGKFLYNVYGA